MDNELCMEAIFYCEALDIMHLNATRTKVKINKHVDNEPRRTYCPMDDGPNELSRNVFLDECPAFIAIWPYASWRMQLLHVDARVCSRESGINSTLTMQPVCAIATA